MGGAFRNGGFEIPAHAHGKNGKAMLGGEIGEIGEMRARIPLHGRDAHQARHRQAKIIPRGTDEGICLCPRAAGFLRFIAGIHLNEDIGPAPLSGHRLGQGLGQFGPIQAFDHIRDPDRIARLIGLQPANDMQTKIRLAGPEGGEFLGGFLDAVFTKNLLASRKGRHNGLSRMGFGNRHQLHGIGRAMGAGAGFRNAGADAAKVFGDGGVFGHGKFRWQGIRRNARVGSMENRLTLALRRFRAPGKRAWPRLWLLSDQARLPDPRAAMRRLPKGAGVVARDLPAGLLPAVARLARQKGLTLLVAGDGRAALASAAGLHVPDRRATTGLLPFLRARRGRRRHSILSLAAHGGAAGAARARRLGVDVVFLSPLFPTASHPGAPALGALRWAALARALALPCMALGGVNAAKLRAVPRRAAGVAAIGGLLPKAVAQMPQ